MQMPPLSPGWEPTRLTLQRYANAVAALPRAGALHDDRWSHVSLHPTDLSDGGRGLASAPTPLSDGSLLVSTLDIGNHQIHIEAGSDLVSVDVSAGPSPKSVGEAVAALAAAHGSNIEVDVSRYDDASEQIYDHSHATAWHRNTMWVVDTFAMLTKGVDGEVAGPHLWPHGFDIATEWFSTKTVGEGESEASPQIAVGFYPSEEDAYFYANPWPFDSAWADAPMPDGVHWHVDGWQGAVLPAANLGGADDRQQVLDFARGVHSLARDALS
ncbi:MAG: DUF5996 family protein [Actinomycetota bacterium]|nr:DUF5996 family protein [Actinomycetota bacterium]